MENEGGGGGVTTKECEAMIQRSLQIPKVKTLIQNLEKAGCAIVDKFISAVHCDNQFSGGYVRGSGDCIRRRAMKSLLANPYCSEAASKDALDAVWDTCYNDTKPFDRAP